MIALKHKFQGVCFMNKKIIITIISVIGAILVIALASFIGIKVVPQKIKTQPVVFDMGNENYCVIFSTSLKGSGYIKYTYEGEEKIIWDTTSGTISTHDTVHRIIVPKNELRNNTYTVGSQFVFYKLGYSALKGRFVEGESVSFKGQEKQDGIKLLTVTDIHGMMDEVKKALPYFTEEYDMLVMLGDIVSDFGNKSRFTDHVLADAAYISKGEIPVVYARGNHETRGEYASQLLQYFPTSTDELYYTFDFGALSAIVLDPGEDKEDDHAEYSGLVDFSSYREKQLRWINSLNKEDFTGKYKIVFSHDPTLSEHFGMDWETPLRELGFNLIAGGHHHRSSLTEGEISVFVAGGKNTGVVWSASSITLENGKIRMLTIDTEGNTILDETISVA